MLSKLVSASLLVLSVSGYAQSWYETVNCMSCVTSSSTQTWWQQSDGYKCTGNVFDEMGCPFSSDCTFDADTCKVATSQYMCADPAESLSQIDLGDVFITNQDGDYIVLHLPPASYAEVTIKSVISKNSEENGEEAATNEITDSEAAPSTPTGSGFLKSALDYIYQGDSDDDQGENKDYSSLVSVGTLQSHQCILIQHAGGDEWTGQKPELKPNDSITLQFMNFEKNCMQEVVVYNWANQKVSDGYKKIQEPDYLPQERC